MEVSVLLRKPETMKVSGDLRRKLSKTEHRVFQRQMDQIRAL